MGGDMRRSNWWAVCGLIVTTWSAHAEGISGTYVGKGPNNAVLLQLVETGGQLTGRYEYVVLGPGGKIERRNAAVTGASDARTVVVTIRPTELLSGGITASGTIEGTTLHLTGGGYGINISLYLLKSDELDFDTQVAKLAEQAQQIIDQEAAQREVKARADIVKRAENFTTRMAASSAIMDSELTKFSTIEQQYRAFTEWMRNALARQHSIYGSWQADVARTQISVSIIQAAVQANQFHLSNENAQRDFESKINSLLTELIDLDKKCKLNSADSVLSAACANFIKSREPFIQRVSTIRQAFTKIEAVWREERPKQERIEQASSAPQ
jgi:hypothetical protein